MGSIDSAILSTDPSVEEIASVVGAVRAWVTLVVCCVGKTFAGTEGDVKSGTSLVFDADVSPGVW